MTTVYALMIITMTGVVEVPNPFKTMNECKEISKSIQFPSYCVEKEVENPEVQMNRMLTLMNRFKKEFIE
jgi:hypothetical protein